MVGECLHPDIAAATVRDRKWHRPPTSLEKRRLRWLESTFSLDLVETLHSRLPHDVCRNIASYCAEERAVQVVRSLWTRSGRAQPGWIWVPFQAQTELWAQVIHFEGNRYIMSLSYESRGGGEIRLITKEQSGPLNIFILHDHLGVLDIVATENNQVPRSYPESGRWWTIYPQQKLPLYFTGQFDVSLPVELSI
jgi:hypothetical protein